MYKLSFYLSLHKLCPSNTLPYDYVYIELDYDPSKDTFQSLLFSILEALGIDWSLEIEQNLLKVIKESLQRGKETVCIFY